MPAGPTLVVILSEIQRCWRPQRSLPKIHSKDKGDVSDWLDADRAAKFIDVCFDVPKWRPSSSPPTWIGVRASNPGAACSCVSRAEAS
jgi:hypothetical protein